MHSRCNIHNEMLMYMMSCQSFSSCNTRGVTLAHLAHDVLAIPVLIVASESVFSTSRRILDDFRSHLTPFMVEALVCTQDWLQRTTPINIQEDMEQLAELEKGNHGFILFIILYSCIG